MEYSPEFSKRLIEAAEALVQKSGNKDEAHRTILYLSSLSCEINLKAQLVHLGYTPRELRGFSHNLNDLLRLVCDCRFKDSSQSASALRSKTVLPGTENGTVGTLLTAEISGASKYPNEIRYGEIIQHYPPTAMLECARIVNLWCEENRDNLYIPE